MYFNKVEKLMVSMKETNFVLFEGDSDEAFEFVQERLDKLVAYPDFVARQQGQLTVARFRFDDPEKIKDFTMDLDHRRNLIHENCISSIAILNRMFKQSGLEPFADVEIDTRTGRPDRYQVANVAGIYMMEAYAVGRGLPMDYYTKDINGDAFDAAVKLAEEK